MKEEKRIYVVIPAVVDAGKRKVTQPPGRQIAQACHVVSRLRNYQIVKGPFKAITTIILQARDTAELVHIGLLLLKTMEPITFLDENDEAYGPNRRPVTALAVYATPSQVKGILDYLPLWGS